MSMVNNDECEKAGIDQKVVAALARRIESVCRDADKLGITVFMGSCKRIHLKPKLIGWSFEASRYCTRNYGVALCHSHLVSGKLFPDTQQSKV